MYYYYIIVKVADAKPSSQPRYPTLFILISCGWLHDDENVDSVFALCSSFSTLDVQQVIIGEHVPYEQQEQNSSVHPELPQIKEEVEELWSIQEGEHVPVKSQENDEKTQSSCCQSKQADFCINSEAVAEQCDASEPVRKLRTLVNHRLTAAVEEMLGLFETTVAEYEEEIQGLRKLLGETVVPEGLLFFII